MGLELKNCRATIKSVTATGALHVDSNELKFCSKDMVWSVRVGKGTKAKVSDGNLNVARGAKSASFAIGAKADQWAEKVLNPPTRATKLGLKSEYACFVKGDFDSAFESEIAANGLKLVRSAKSCDIAFVLLTTKPDLKVFDKFIASTSVGTHVWAVWPKGVEAIRQGDIIAIARKNGIGPGKGISFDETHSAMRFTKK